MFSKLRAACLLLVLSSAAPARAQDSTGPLTVRSMAPIFPNRLSYTPSPVPPLPVNTVAVQALITHANIWAQMPGYFFDGEWTRLDLRAAYGLPYGLEVQVELPILHRMGGFLDSFIMGFHSLFHVTQSRRDQYPKDTLRVSTFDAQGEHPQLTNRDAGWGVGNPSVGIKKALLDNVSAELLFKLPVGSIASQFATPDLAFLVDVALTQALGAGFALDAATGLIVSPGEQRVYGMQLALIQKFLLVAIQWRASPSVAIVLQYLNQDGIAETCAVAPLNQTTHEFALGVKVMPAANWVLEAGILENSVHDANTPDFGLHGGVRWLF